MSDLISRQAAIDALAKFVPYAICDESTESYTNGLTDAYNLICQLPSAQPERKKGHWVEIGDEPYDEWECDVCGFVIDGSGCIDPEEYRDVYRFCPRCCSDMRVEQDG